MKTKTEEVIMVASSVATSLQQQFLLLICFLLVSGASSCSSEERQALLAFKQGLTDPSNRLSSWSLNQTDDYDCCLWSGVRCHNLTRAVTELHLRNPSADDYKLYMLHALGGDISPSLLQLESLTYLDLSYNDFQGIPIPSFLGSITGLRFLNLNGAAFEGLIPSQLQNLSNIRVLGLGDNGFGLRVDSLGWIAHLRSLEILDMSYIDLQVQVDWLQVVSMLPSLVGLRLESCKLHSMVPPVVSLGHNNFSSLQALHLSSNRFSSRIPDWLFNLTSNLRELDLSSNSLYGEIPESLTTLSMLNSLVLHNNSLTGHLGHNVNFSSLRVLDLGYNNFSSMIPDRLFNLTSNLRKLDLSSNSLYGEIPESLTTLRMLNYLALGYNPLTGSIPSGIGQLKHLENLGLQFSNLNGSIPWSIGNLTSLGWLVLNSNKLSGNIPDSIGLLSNLESLQIYSNPMLGGIVSEAILNGLPKLKYLSLSSPLIAINIVNPSWTPPFQLHELLMSSSKIGPNFPSWLRTQTSLRDLDISMSGIEDTVPEWFWELASGSIHSLYLYENQMEGDLTRVLFNSTTVSIGSNCFSGQLPRLSSNVINFYAGNNTMSGPISTLICGETNGNNNLKDLDLSNNNLSGQLSSCWMHWRSLVSLDLRSNNLSGKIPISIGSLYKLQSLQLGQNRLFGNIPLSLKNCTDLRLIGLDANELTGIFPSWIAEIKDMLILVLGSNKFTGSIPPQLCRLSHIVILDLSNNNFSGTLPKCLGNFSSMVDGKIIPGSSPRFPSSLELMTKGVRSTYTYFILRFVKLIDFSNNMLSGTIPVDISQLSALHFLNLSHNHLVGEIPKKIGNMKNLESLDLSRNQLSGEIPGSMTELSFLNNLDLSYNNLSGDIPLSTQLQSFNESSFLGNVRLCGAPLEKHCKNDTHPGLPRIPAEGDAQEESEDVMFWFYIGVGPGFACAFVGVCSTLYFNTAWRQALFQFLEDTMNQFYVYAFIMVNRIKRRLNKRSNLSVG